MKILPRLLGCWNFLSYDSFDYPGKLDVSSKIISKSQVLNGEEEGNKKIIFYLSSADFALRKVKVNVMIFTYRKDRRMGLIEMSTIEEAILALIVSFKSLI